MFNWKRPKDMPIEEPSEEQIWATIEACDPHYSVSIHERLLWHQEMLEGRNIYGNTFSRSSRIGICEAELPSGHDPADWIINLNLRHNHDVPLEKVADCLSTGHQDVLQPVCDDAFPTDEVRLLSHQILNHKSEDWDPKSMFGTPSINIRGYVEWARYHLQAHYRILKRAGVYEAIYASLFDYSSLPFAWIRGIAEHWDKTTNTCWVGPEELTITLADMQDITGLPIFGTPYEECIPPDHELFQRHETNGKERGSFLYPNSLHYALAHYKKFFKEKTKSRKRRSAITLELWVKSFLHKNMCSDRYARLSDPFNIRVNESEISFKERFEPEREISSRHVLMSNINEEMSLIAFIATWLCYFVFPSKNKLFRPSTLLIASLISRGERIALAPAVLAYLYNGLGQVSALTNSRRYDVEAPWHYLHGWIYAHISGSFSCTETPKYFKECHFPIMMQLSKAIVSVNMI